MVRWTSPWPAAGCGSSCGCVATATAMAVRRGASNSVAWRKWKTWGKTMGFLWKMLDTSQFYRALIWDSYLRWDSTWEILFNDGEHRGISLRKTMKNKNFIWNIWKSIGFNMDLRWWDILDNDGKERFDMGFNVGFLFSWNPIFTSDLFRWKTRMLLGYINGI